MTAALLLTHQIAKNYWKILPIRFEMIEMLSYKKTGSVINVKVEFGEDEGRHAT